MISSELFSLFLFNKKKVNDSLEVKLCDFGNAVDLLKEKNYDAIGRNTLIYSAPEIFEKNVTCTPKVDIYGLGALIWSLLKGEEPFSNVQTSYHIIVYIKNGYILENQILV